MTCYHKLRVPEETNKEWDRGNVPEWRNTYILRFKDEYIIKNKTKTPSNIMVKEQNSKPTWHIVNHRENIDYLCQRVIIIKLELYM